MMDWLADRQQWLWPQRGLTFRPRLHQLRVQTMIALEAYIGRYPCTHVYFEHLSEVSMPLQITQSTAFFFFISHVWECKHIKLQIYLTVVINILICNSCIIAVKKATSYSPKKWKPLQNINIPKGWKAVCVGETRFRELINFQESVLFSIFI